MDKYIDKLLFIDNIKKEIEDGIEFGFRKEIYKEDFELYIKIAEIENFKLNDFKELDNDVIHVEHIMPIGYCDNNDKEKRFSLLTLGISKINVFKNISNKIFIRFNGFLKYRQYNGYEKAIELNNELFVLETFKDLYDDEYFLKEMEKVIEDVKKQIDHLLKKQVINI